MLYSLLAISAMHRSRIGFRELDEAAEAEDFHKKCVSLLLPMLQDQRCVTDAAFLACSTILRFYEEISGKSFVLNSGH